MNFILSNIQIPVSNPHWALGLEWLSRIMYGILEWGTSFINDYWLVIIFFTLFMRLITLPVDFLNKYFTKKNAIKMAEMKPEDDQLKKQYAGDTMGYNRAKQVLNQKHGYSMGGFCLVSLLNIVVVLMVFMGVLSALREVSELNIYTQYAELYATYEEYKDEDAEVLSEKLNETYDKSNVSFLWVKNIWRPDTWGSQILDYNEFVTAANNVKNFKLDESVPQAEIPDEEFYNTLYAPIRAQRGGWNGWLILIVLAGATSYLSGFINAKQMAKKAEAAKTPEPEISYSMRKAKEQESPASMPQIDPAMMNNMMKYIMPIIMVIFTFSSTAALALYFTVSSLLSTGFSLLTGFAVDKILAKQKQSELDKQDETVINPHAKYFKKTGRK